MSPKKRDGEIRDLGDLDEIRAMEAVERRERRAVEVLTGIALIAAGEWLRQNKGQWRHAAFALARDVGTDRASAQSAGAGLKLQLLERIAPRAVELASDPTLTDTQRADQAAELGAAIARQLLAPSLLPET